MRILIITAQFYPARSPNVYRWAAIAGHWAKEGHEVHLLCTRFAGAPAREQISGIIVHRAGQFTLLDWFFNTFKIKANRRGTLGAGKLKPSLFRRLTEVLVNLTWRNFYFPDGSCLWYFPGKRKAMELMQAHRFDAIVSVSQPFTSALIAMVLKKRHSSVRWLMDIEDPFALVDAYFINNRFLYKRLNFMVEAAALRRADAISLTVESARQAYLNAFQDSAGKMQVVPPLLEIVPPDPNFKLPPATGDKIHLGYFGTFYPKIRSPKGLLNLLNQAMESCPALKNQVVFHLAGEIPPEYAGEFSAYPALKNNFLFYGLISRERVASLMRAMDFLINIGNTTTNQLPSKCVEYLAMGKPIVNLCQSREDTFANFFKDYPLLLNLYSDGGNHTPEQVAQFCDFLSKQKRRKMPPDWVAARTKPFEIEAVASAFERLLAGV